VRAGASDGHLAAVGGVIGCLLVGGGESSGL